MAETRIRYRWSLNGLALVIVTFALVAPSNELDDLTLPPGLLYPFGEDVGDDVVIATDDGFAGPIKLSSAFLLKNESYTQLYVSNNGFISFNTPHYSWFRPQEFPITNVRNAMVAVYWADSDVSLNSGRTYYREVTDDSYQGDILLSRATEDVQRFFTNLPDYKAKWMFISTWHNVTFIGGNSSTKVNTFQAILVSDFMQSMVMFNYGKLTWTSSDSISRIEGIGRYGAQAGYNSGHADEGFNEELPEALTEKCLIWAKTSNIGLTGRWALRVGKIKNDLGCYTNEAGECPIVYQIPHPKTGVCVDVAPAFDCPIFEGPSVINRMWFEFYCTVNTTVTDAEAVFEVTFLFNGRPSSDVPTIIATADKPKVTLHERFISGHIGKSLSCSIISYWVTTPQARSRSSTTPDYFLGVQVSTRFLSVKERDSKPQTVLLKSTLPITCQDAEAAASATPCQLELILNVTSDIVVRQRNYRSQRFVFKETEWKDQEKVAYSNDTFLEIIAKVDSFSTAPRVNHIRSQSVNLSNKWYDGSTYNHPWTDFELAEITVLHDDTQQNTAYCRLAGDPQFVSFDGVIYQSNLLGSFVYASGSYPVKFEIQGRHKSCSTSAAISCLCGVAVIENDSVLVFDWCASTGILSIECHNCMASSSCGISISSPRFQMFTPGGIIISGMMNQNGAYNYLSVTIDIPKFPTSPIEGLCGTADNNNKNEVKARYMEIYGELVNGQFYPDNFANTWMLKQCEDIFSPCFPIPAATHGVSDVYATPQYHRNASNPECGGPFGNSAAYYRQPGVMLQNCRPLIRDDCGCRYVVCNEMLRIKCNFYSN